MQLLPMASSPDGQISARYAVITGGGGGGGADFAPSQIGSGKFRCGKFCRALWVLCGTPRQSPHVMVLIGLFKHGAGEGGVPVGKCFRGRTVRWGRAAPRVGYLGPVIPDGQGDRVRDTGARGHMPLLVWALVFLVWALVLLVWALVLLVWALVLLVWALVLLVWALVLLVWALPLLVWTLVLLVGATTIGPDATHPPAICQNLRGGGGGEQLGQGGGGGIGSSAGGRGCARPTTTTCIPLGCVCVCVCLGPWG